MRGKIIGVGLFLWLVAFVVFIVGASAGFFGLVGGVVIGGFLGLVGAVVILAGLVMSHPARTCYICGAILTNDKDYKRHFQVVHPGQNP